MSTKSAVAGVDPAQLQAQNNAIRQMILSNGIARLQQISSQSVNVAGLNGSPVAIQPQNVGIIRGFLVQIDAVLTNTGGAAANLTAFGLWNLLSRVGFTDFNNIDRINTRGFMLGMLNSAKNNMVFGGAYAPNIPVDFGNNYPVQTGPQSIAAGASANLSMFLYVPLAYAKSDLRGAVYAGLIGAVSKLSLTLNPNPVVAAGGETDAVYAGSAGAYGNGGNVQITVYQDYIDQLPMNQGQPILPPVDLSTIYDLKDTSQSGFVANQDFGIGYANFRTFLSTCLVFDNGGQLNPGTDITSFALTLANASNIWKYGPKVAAMLARGQFMADPPAGAYWFDSRQAPVNTQQWGNAELVVNASTVNAGAKLLVGYEAFAMTQTIGAAGSLPS